MKQRTGAYVVFDAHEYAPLEYENRFLWKLAHGSHRRYMLRCCAPFVDASVTVVRAIARRLQTEFGLHPIVVMNAAQRGSTRARANDPDRIRIVHHGAAAPDRETDRMIRAVASSASRYTLDLLLIGDDAYIERLRRLAARIAPTRIAFRDPVPANRIVEELALYDIGMFILRPNNYNYRVALPNKLFDFIAAGLAVCIGPSEEMVRLIEHYGCGVVAPSYEPRDVANTLDRLSFEQILELEERSWLAARELNADVEMAKLRQLYSVTLRGAERSHPDSG